MRRELAMIEKPKPAFAIGERVMINSDCPRKDMIGIKGKVSKIFILYGKEMIEMKLRRAGRKIVWLRLEVKYVSKCHK